MGFHSAFWHGVRGLHAMARGLGLPKPTSPWWVLPRIFVARGWCLFQRVETGKGWLAGSITFGPVPALVAIVLGFLAGTRLAALLPGLRTVFISKREMQVEAESRAAEVFQRIRLRKIKGRTGILIYVSLYEHKVRMLGNRAISKKLDQEQRQVICGIIIFWL